MPSDFNEFLPIPKQGCWPPSKLLAVLRNQFCILGTMGGKLPQRSQTKTSSLIGSTWCPCAYPLGSSETSRAPRRTSFRSKGGQANIYRL